MSFNYAPIKATADNLLANFGQTGELIDLISLYDAVAGKSTIDFADRSDCKFVEVLAKKSIQSRFQDNFVKDLIKGKVKVYIMSNVVDFAPTEGMVIKTSDGKYFDVKGVSPLQPSGDPIIYYVGLSTSGRNDLAEADSLSDLENAIDNYATFVDEDLATQ